MPNYLNNFTTKGTVKTGVAEFVLMAFASSFSTIQSPVAPFNAPGDSITIKTAHVFAPPATGFAKYALAPQKNRLKASVVGDLGMNKYNQEFEFFFPGSSAELHEFMQTTLNQQLVILIKDADCSANMFYQLGCDCTYAYMTGEFDTSTTKDGTKGFMCKAIYDGAVQIYNVTGGPALISSATLTAPSLTSSLPTTTTLKASWPAVANATGYAYDISASPSFASLIAGGSGTNPAGTLFNVFSGLTTATTYYIRVKALDSTGVNATSAYGYTSAITA